MAEVLPLVTRKCVLLAKAETTYGTGETLVAADGVFNAFNVQFTPEIEMESEGRDSQGAQVAAAVNSRKATITFETDLVGDGADTTPAWATLFLPACGYIVASAAIYKPAGYAIPITMWYLTKKSDADNYVAQKASGCVGTFKIVVTADKIAKVQFTFTGKLLADADFGALVLPTTPTVKAPKFVGNAFTLGTYHPKVSQITFDAGNDVVLLDDGEGVGAGYRFAAIADQKPTAEMDPEATLVATQDWQGIQLAGTEAALSCAIGTTQYNIITITAAAAQIAASPFGDRSKIATRQVKLQFNGVTPMWITFT